MLRILLISLFFAVSVVGCGHSDRFDPPTVTDTGDDGSGGDGSGDDGSGDDGSGDDGSGDDGTTEQTINIVPSLGLINGADVTISMPDGTPLTGASGALDATGSVSITHDGTYTGPIVVTVTGNDAATYFDESAGATLPMPSSVSIRAYAPALGDSIGVTILTELAAQVAETFGSSVTASDIEAINNSIRDTLAPGLEDILTPPTIVSEDNFTAQSLADDQAGIYALTLAGLATMAAGDTSPALTILEQLAADLADGDIDGIGASGALSGLAYSASDFVSLFNAAIQTAAAGLADADLVSSAGNITVSITNNVFQVVSDSGVSLPDAIKVFIDAGGDSSGGGSSSGGGVAGLYDLTITGNITTFGVSTGFDVEIANIVAPSPSDTTEVSQVIEETVAGLTNITNLSITVVTNTDDHVTFDVSFTATQGGVEVTVDLRYDYVKSGSDSSGSGDSGSGDAGSGDSDDTGGTDTTGDIASLGQVCFFGGEPTATTIPADLSGLFNVRYREVNPGGPWGDNELVHFFINRDGENKLNINNQTILSTPVQCGSNEHEAIWKDSSNNVIYSLSSLVTGFNEINVNSANDGSFLGQFSDPE